jgi:hypothetical protein
LIGWSHVIQQAVWIKSAVYATLTTGNSLLSRGYEGIDLHPQQREYGSKEDGPNDDDGRRTVLFPHETLQERVEVEDHPDCKEQLPE